MGDQHPAVHLHVVHPDDWESHRDLRLAALLDAPDAFWFTHADEAAYEEADWRERIAGAWLVQARDADGVLGTAGLGSHWEPERAAVAALFGMYVTPRAAVGGVGRGARLRGARGGSATRQVRGAARGDEQQPLGAGALRAMRFRRHGGAPPPPSQRRAARDRDGRPLEPRRTRWPAKDSDEPSPGRELRPKGSHRQFIQRWPLARASGTPRRAKVYPMTDITVRFLGEDDWQDYRSVRLAALRESPEAFVATVEEEEAFDEELWRDRMRRSARLVAERQGQAVGVVSVGRAASDEGDAGELFGLWVRPEARGLGVATRLVKDSASLAARVASRTSSTGSAPRTDAPSPSRAAWASGPPTTGGRWVSSAKRTARRRSPWCSPSAPTPGPLPEL